MANLDAWSFIRTPCARRTSSTPNELRIDLDPLPGIEVVAAAGRGPGRQEVLADFSLVGWPKTFRLAGYHVNVRIHRRGRSRR